MASQAATKEDERIKEFTLSLDDAIINHYAAKKLEAETFLSRYVLDAQNTFVTGGFFARLFHNLPIKDIDIFVRNSVNFDFAKQLYMNDARFRLIESRARFCKFAIVGFDFTLDLVGFTNRANSEDLIRKFDFTITRFKYENGRLSAFNESDIQDLFLKKLKYTNNILFTTSKNNTLTRAERYRQLGFSLEEDFFERVSTDLLRKINRRRTYATSTGPVSEATLLSTGAIAVTEEEETTDVEAPILLFEFQENRSEEELINYNPPEQPPLQIQTETLNDNQLVFASPLPINNSIEALERLLEIN